MIISTIDYPYEFDYNATNCRLDGPIRVQVTKAAPKILPGAVGELGVLRYMGVWGVAFMFGFCLKYLFIFENDCSKHLCLFLSSNPHLLSN